jgi:hypothetical protein
LGVGSVAWLHRFYHTGRPFLLLPGHSRRRLFRHIKVKSTLVSLDGVFESPHVWANEYFDRDAEEFALELLSGVDAMLMGRRTYEFFEQAFPSFRRESRARRTSDVGR